MFDPQDGHGSGAVGLDSISVSVSCLSADRWTDAAAVFFLINFLVISHIPRFDFIEIKVNSCFP
jgi:hypothetical protein